MRGHRVLEVTIAVLGWTAAFVLTDIAQAAPNSSAYHVVRTIAIGGSGRWDYCAVDSAARRVYVSHGTHVVVLDADSGAVVGDVPNILGVHGIALATDLGRGFITAGCETFAHRVVTAELDAYSSATAVAYRIAWV